MTTLHVQSHLIKWRVTGRVHDVSIPLNFNQAQPNHFTAQAARSEPMTAGSFIGDTRLGGSCNAETVTINPHCNGTHTECVGHLTLDRVAIRDHSPSLPLLAGLITLSRAVSTKDAALCLEITAPMLHDALAVLPNQPIKALLIRTEPNSEKKLTHHYQGAEDTPFYSPEAMEVLVRAGIEHLLVDVPSLDPYHDDGQLAAHRVFFGLPTHHNKPQVTAKDATRAFATVTELIYASSSLKDGIYLLNLQLPSFNLDAAPSRPLLYELEREQ